MKMVRVETRGKAPVHLGDDGGVRVIGAPKHDAQVAHERVNLGLLAEPERRALRWLAQRTPAEVTPDHLTVLGVAGAVLVMVGLLGTNFSPGLVTLAILGLFLNWFGDSLDGTLARYRRIERPQFGYFMDHACDLISQTLIFIGLGVSPYFTLFSALLALSMYLLMSSYTYLKVMILRTHQLSYGGMGATELRVGIAAWCLLGILVGPGLTTAEFMHHRVLDEAIGGMWLLVFAGFVLMVRSDLVKFHGLFHGAEVACEPATDSGAMDVMRRAPSAPCRI